MQALYFAWLLAWKQEDVEELQHLVWKRVAWVCKYAGGGAFVWAMDRHAMNKFMEATAELIEEEKPDS